MQYDLFDNHYDTYGFPHTEITEDILEVWNQCRTDKYNSQTYNANLFRETLNKFPEDKFRGARNWHLSLGKLKPIDLNDPETKFRCFTNLGDYPMPQKKNLFKLFNKQISNYGKNI